MANNKVTKVILDAGTDTALLVEQLSNPTTAMIRPISESIVTQRLMKRKIYSTIAKSVIGIIWLFNIYIIKGMLNESTLPDMAINFIYFGLIGLAVFGVIFLFKIAAEIFDSPDSELLERYARDELRHMKNKNISVEEYLIKSSYLYNGTDGDFITWYKQEKMKL